MENQYIDPEELHFSQPEDDFPELDLNSSRSSTHNFQDLEIAVPSGFNLANEIDSASSIVSQHSLSHDQLDAQPGKAYTPRPTTAGRKSTKAALRVRPRNGQHARELERNRHAAANYRSRQKNQLDSLLTRVRKEEHRMIKQKSMVCSLKEELWHLRNNLMARQQMQIFGMGDMKAGATPVQQSFNFDPASGVSQQL